VNSDEERDIEGEIWSQRADLNARHSETEAIIQIAHKDRRLYEGEKQANTISNWGSRSLPLLVYVMSTLISRCRWQNAVGRAFRTWAPGFRPGESADSWGGPTGSKGRSRSGHATTFARSGSTVG